MSHPLTAAFAYPISTPLPSAAGAQAQHARHSGHSRRTAHLLDRGGARQCPEVGGADPGELGLDGLQQLARHLAGQVRTGIKRFYNIEKPLKYNPVKYNLVKPLKYNLEKYNLEKPLKYNLLNP